jgi:hypothetical protein
LEERSKQGEKDIKNFMRERDLLNKDVVAAEEQGKKKVNDKKTEDNEIKKLNNKHTGFKAQADKLHQ